MGKAKSPKTIVVTDKATFNSKEVQALKEKGHTLFLMEQFYAGQGGYVSFDLVIGRVCRMVIPETIKYVGLALKELGKVEVAIEDDPPDMLYEEEEDDAT